MSIFGGRGGPYKVEGPFLELSQNGEAPIRVSQWGLFIKVKYPHRKGPHLYVDGTRLTKAGVPDRRYRPTVHCCNGSCDIDIRTIDLLPHIATHDSRLTRKRKAKP